MLGVSQNATDDEIKKAYRTLAKQLHPDANPGDKTAEERFKKVADAYSVLGDKKKKKEYDDLRRPKFKENRAKMSFDDFIRDQFKSNAHGWKAESSRWGRTYTEEPYVEPTKPSKDYLDIRSVQEVDFLDALSGKEIVFSYEKQVIVHQQGTSNSFKRKKEEKEVKVNLNLRSVHLKLKEEDGIVKTRIRLSQMGNEDAYAVTTARGGVENLPLFGDLIIDIIFKMPHGIRVEGSNIIQSIEIGVLPLLVKGTTIPVETIFGKKYDIEITGARTFSNLGFTITKEGILGENNKLGDYLVRFEVLVPDIKSMKKEDRDELIALLGSS